MQNNQNILTHFQSLERQQIKELSPQEMKNMLLALHSGTRTCSTHQNNYSTHKHKNIHKIVNKSMIKEYIRRKLRSKARQNVRRRAVVKSSQNMVSGDKSHHEEEGKLKFNLGANIQTNHKIQNFSRNIHQALLDKNSDQLSCSICLQILICPALTSCGHTFCYQCIDESLLFSHNCPNCRENIRGCELTICSVLDKLIKFRMRLYKDKLNEEFIRYWSRGEQFETWKKSRTLDYDNVVKGQVVDARDTQTIWCQGTVVQVYKTFDKKKSKNVTKSILIHYNRWHTIYNEIIQVPSVRLAPLSYYSSRSDILHYNLAEADGNVRGSVTTGVVRLDAPRVISYIRIDQSNDEIDSQPFFSEISDQDQESLSNRDQDMNQDNLNRLAPDQVESPHPSSSISWQNDLRQYVNQVRRTALSRLAPAHFPRSQPIEESQYSFQIGHERALQNQEQSQDELSFSQQRNVQHENEEQLQQGDDNFFQMSPPNYQESMDLLKDVSDQNRQMFGPQDPSNMLQQYE